MNIKNLSKKQINTLFRENLDNQIVEKKQKNKTETEGIQKFTQEKMEKEYKFKEEEKLKKIKKESLLQNVLDSRKENIIHKKLMKQEQNKFDLDLDKQRVQNALLEIEQEKQRKIMKKEEEKRNLQMNMNHTEQVSKQKNNYKKNELENQKQYLNEYDNELAKQDNERKMYHNNVQERMQIQDLRVKAMEDYLKCHSERNPNYVIKNENIINDNKHTHTINNNNITNSNLVQNSNNILSHNIIEVHDNRNNVRNKKNLSNNKLVIGNKKSLSKEKKTTIKNNNNNNNNNNTPRNHSPSQSIPISGVSEAISIMSQLNKINSEKTKPKQICSNNINNGNSDKNATTNNNINNYTNIQNALNKRNKSPIKKNNILQREIQENDNKDLLDKRHKLQLETNRILKQQIEDKQVLRKRLEEEKTEYKKKLNKEYNDYNNSKKNDVAYNKEKVNNYKEELGKQLTSNKGLKAELTKNNNNVINKNKIGSNVFPNVELINNTLNKNLNNNSIKRVNTKQDGFAMMPKIIMEIIDKLYFLGEHSILRLENILKIYDSNNTDTIKFSEFAELLLDFGLVTSTDIKVDDLLFKIFTVFIDETSTTELVSISVFINSLRGNMPGKRVLIIKRIFDNLSNTLSLVFNKKNISYGMIKRSLRAFVRPEGFPLAGFSEEEVLKDLEEAWETYITLTYFPDSIIDDKLDRSKIEQAEITDSEFLNFYSYVSPFIEDDDDFEVLVAHSYKLKKDEFVNKNPITVKGKDSTLPEIKGKKRVKSGNSIANAINPITNKVSLLNDGEYKFKNVERYSSIFQRLRLFIYNSLGSLCVIKLKNIIVQLVREVNSFSDLLNILNQRLKLSLNTEEIELIEDIVSEDKENIDTQEKINNLYKYLLLIDCVSPEKKKAIYHLFKNLALTKGASNIPKDQLDEMRQMGELDDLNSNSSIKVDLNYLFQKFKPELHSRVLYNKKKENEVVREFHQILNFHFSSYDIESLSPYYVSREEFESFMCHLAITMEDSVSDFTCFSENCFLPRKTNKIKK